jgi:thiosulfate dehydrogenase (quinone) large subunit
MSTIRKQQQMPDADLVLPEGVVAAEGRRQRAFRHVAAATRLSLGWVFLWAFLDKTFALGFATGVDPETGAVDRFGGAAWINGGSPTEGFLQFGTEGKWLHGFYSSDLFAGAWADWLFMLGLLGVGLTLMLGIGMRIGAVAGALLLLLMWSAELPLENNPFMDDHIVYALVLVMLVLAKAGHTLGLGKTWESVPFVTRNGWLK